MRASAESASSTGGVSRWAGCQVRVKRSRAPSIASNSAVAVPSSSDEGQRRAEPEGVRAGGGHDAVGDQLGPWRDRPVVGSQDELQPHPDAAPQAFDDAHEAGRSVTPWRHEVGDPDGTVGRLEVGVEDERVRADTDALVASTSSAGATSQRPWRSSPSRAEKHDGGVEAGEAQPVDRTVATDEGCGPEVSRPARSPRSTSIAVLSRPREREHHRRVGASPATLSCPEMARPHSRGVRRGPSRARRPRSCVHHVPRRRGY